MRGGSRAPRFRLFVSVDERVIPGTEVQAAAGYSGDVQGLVVR